MNHSVSSEPVNRRRGRADTAIAWALTALAGLGAALPAARAAEAQPPAVVVYWTAGDCVWCKVWKTGDRHDEFQAEAARLGVRLVTVAKPSLRDADTAYKWPEEPGLASPAPLVASAPKMLPSFDFVCPGKPPRRLAGLADWDSFWRSQLRQIARDCAASARS